MFPATATAPVRRALCVAVSEFDLTPLGEEPPLDAPADLPFAKQRRDELTSALQRLGYDCTDLTNLGAAEIGRRALDWIREPATGPEVRVVHVLSHGRLSPRSAALRIVGHGGSDHPDAIVERWLGEAADKVPPVPTLFLLDLCGAGELTSVEWDLSIPAGERAAWVIAASEAASPSYNGRLTRAATSVLSRVADGRLSGIDASVAHVPLETIAREINKAVLDIIARDGGRRQLVTGTRIGVTEELPELPFFDNPAYERSHAQALRDSVDPAVRPYLDAVDRLVDPVHFISRARGLSRSSAPEAASCFTGRQKELEALSEWMDGGDGLRVVTGSPGVGKSALLGVLVCAAHPVLRASSVWHAVKESTPSRNEQLAAVHARQRTLDQIVGSLGRQLDLVVSGSRPAAALVSAIVRREEQPVIVIDALDEAADPPALLGKLLVPLARARRPDGRAACRLLVGARPWPQFVSLFDLAGGGLIDLDLVDPDEVRQDLHRYVTTLLKVGDRYGDATRRAVRTAIASAVADGLSAVRPPTPQRWGEFLVAGLFVNHVVTTLPVIDAAEEVAARIGAVPRSLPEVFELDLAAEHTPWLRPVLTCVAWAQGDGLPASSIVAAAGAFVDGADARAVLADPVAGEEAVRLALHEGRFYLRTSVDTDGSTLYRLFHQGLADHLRAHAVAASGTTARSLDREVFERLLAQVPVDTADARRWALAEPYLRRNLAGHAVAAGQMDKLLTDAGFLIHASPAELAARVRHARTPAGRRAAAAYLMSYARHANASEERRRATLAIDAARQDDDALAAALCGPSDAAPLPWRPRWATRQEVDDMQIGSFVGHRESVIHARCLTYRNRHLAVTAGVDGEVRVWDLVTTAERETFAGRNDRIAAMDVAVAASGPVGVLGGADGRIDVIDLGTGSVRRMDDTVGSVLAIRTVTVTGGTYAVSLDSVRGVCVWDVDGGTFERVVIGAGIGVVEIAALAVRDAALIVVATAEGKLSVWDAHTGQVIRNLGAVPGPASSLVAVAWAEHAVASAIDAEGRVQVWDIDTGVIRHTIGWRGAGLRSPFVRVTVAADGHDGVLVAIGGRGDLIAYDAYRGTVTTRATKAPTRPTDVACWPVGGGRFRLAMATGDPVALARTVLRGEPLYEVARPSFRHGATGVQDGDRQWVLGFSGGGPLRFWDSAAGDGPARLPGLRGAPIAVASVRSQEGGVFGIAAFADQTLCVWDLREARLLYTRPSPGVGFVGIAATLDGRHAVAAALSADGTADVWWLATGSRIERIDDICPEPSAVSLARGVGGLTLVAASATGTVHVWGVRPGHAWPRGRFRAEGVTAVAAIPGVEETLILVGDAAGRVHSISTSSLDQSSLKERRQFSAPVQAISVHMPTNKIIVATSRGDIVYVSAGRLLSRKPSLGGQTWPKLKGFVAGLADVGMFTDTGGHASIVVLGIDGRITVRDEKRYARTVLENNRPARPRVRMSPLGDGRSAATVVDGGGRVRVYDLVEARLLVSPRFAVPVRSAVCVSLGSDVLVSGHADGSVQVRALSGAAGESRSWSAHDRAVVDLGVVALDGAGFVATTDGHEVAVWDPGWGERRCTFYPRTADVTGLDVWGGGEQALIAAGGDDGLIDVWDIRTGAPVCRIDVGERLGGFSLGDRWGDPIVIGWDGGGSVREWYALTGSPLLADGIRLPGPVTRARIMMLPTGDPLVVAGQDDGDAQVVDLGSHLGLWRLPARGPLIDIDCMTLRDGRPAVAGLGFDGGVTVFYLDAQQRTRVLPQHNDRIISVAIVPEPTAMVLSGGRDGQLRRWRRDDGRYLRMTELPDWVTGIATAVVDGRDTVVAGCDDHVVYVVPAEEVGKPVGLRGHRNWVTDVACARDRPLAVSTAADGNARVWDLTDGRLRHELPGHRFGLAAVDCATVGGRPVAVAAALNGTAIVWNLDDGLRRHALDRHGARLTSVATVDVDGRPLALVGDADGHACLWDVEAGTHLRCVVSQEDSISGVAAAGVAGRTVLAVAVDDAVVVHVPDAARTYAITLPDRVGALALAADGSLAVGFGAELILVQVAAG